MTTMAPASWQAALSSLTGSTTAGMDVMCEKLHMVSDGSAASAARTLATKLF